MCVLSLKAVLTIRVSVLAALVRERVPSENWARQETFGDMLVTSGANRSLIWMLAERRTTPRCDGYSHEEQSVIRVFTADAVTKEFQ
jgi:hypothetical protein